MNDTSYGSAARLKQVITFGTLVNGTPFESGPTLHETLHHWSMYLDSSFGFDEARQGTGGYASANGLHGGFAQQHRGVQRQRPEADGLDFESGVPAHCGPADEHPAGALLALLRRGHHQLSYSPITELYLMGLVPSSQVVSPLWVAMGQARRTSGPVTADGGGNIIAMNYDIASFHVVGRSTTSSRRKGCVLPRHRRPSGPHSCS